jgi:hypothetical protein
MKNIRTLILSAALLLFFGSFAHAQVAEPTPDGKAPVAAGEPTEGEPAQPADAKPSVAEVPPEETTPTPPPSGMGRPPMQGGSTFPLKVNVSLVGDKWEPSPSAGQDVKLDVLVGRTVVKSYHANSDAEGVASFASVTSMPGVQYSVTVSYEGTAFHSTSPVVPSDAATASVLLYPSTGDPSGIVVKNLRMTVDLGEKYLFLRQTWTIANTKPAVFNSTKSTDPLHADGLALVLPASADSLHAKIMFGEGTMEEGETVQNKVLIATPIMPTHASGRPIDVQVSYSMKLNTATFEYAQKMNFPVESAEVIVSQTTGYARFPTLNLALSAPGFSRVGNNRTVPGYRQDLNFLVAQGARVPKDASLVFVVTGYPVGDSPMRWYALGAALLAVLGGVVLYGGERRRIAAGGATAKGEALVQERERLYEILVGLEDDYDRGQVSARVYEIEGAQTRERLALVLRLLDDIGGRKGQPGGKTRDKA